MGLRHSFKAIYVYCKTVLLSISLLVVGLYLADLLNSSNYIYCLKLKLSLLYCVHVFYTKI